jgi:hypothetical protein
MNRLLDRFVMFGEHICNGIRLALIVDLKQKSMKIIQLLNESPDNGTSK